MVTTVILLITPPLKVPIRPKFSIVSRCLLIVLWDSQILRCSLIVSREFRTPESTLFWTVFRAFPPWKLQKWSNFFSRASRAKFSKFRRCSLIVLWDSHIFRRCLVVRGGLLIVLPWYIARPKQFHRNNQNDRLQSKVNEENRNSHSAQQTVGNSCYKR